MSGISTSEVVGLDDGFDSGLATQKDDDGLDTGVSTPFGFGYRSKTQTPDTHHMTLATISALTP